MGLQECAQRCAHCEPSQQRRNREEARKPWGLQCLLSTYWPDGPASACGALVAHPHATPHTLYQPISHALTHPHSPVSLLPACPAQPIRVVQLSQTGDCARSCAFSPDGQHLAIGMASGGLKVGERGWGGGDLVCGSKVASIVFVKHAGMGFGAG